MMNTVQFETDAGAVFRPYADYGLLLVEYDAPEPTPKTYRVSLEGMNGAVDMSEWAGVVYFNTRTVSMVIRDLESRAYQTMVQFLHGRKVKITFSDQPEWYFYGRCESVASQTRKRVTNTTLSFICDPFKLAHIETVKAFTASGTAQTDLLYTSRRRLVPQIVVSDAATLAYNNATYTLTEGTHKPPTFIVDDTPREVSITGSGTVDIIWRDGVL